MYQVTILPESRVVPEEVGVAVVVVVSRARDQPVRVGGLVGSRGGRRGFSDQQLQFPDQNLAGAGVAPDEVGRGVMVEVRRGRQLPAGRQGAQVGQGPGRADAVRAVHEPELHLARGPIPEDQVVAGIAVEVVDATQEPVGADDVGRDGGLGGSRGAVHEPGLRRRRRQRYGKRGRRRRRRRVTTGEGRRQGCPACRSPPAGKPGVEHRDRGGGGRGRSLRPPRQPRSRQGPSPRRRPWRSKPRPRGGWWALAWMVPEPTGPGSQGVDAQAWRFVQITRVALASGRLDAGVKGYAPATEPP